MTGSESLSDLYSKTNQNKTKANFEKHAETSGHLHLHALIACNSGQRFAGNSELLAVHCYPRNGFWILFCSFLHAGSKRKANHSLFLRHFLRIIRSQTSTKFRQKLSKDNTNRKIPNYLWPLFQSKSWCSFFHMKTSFDSHANVIIFI